MNAVMAGALYFLGTAIGVTGRLVGGELLTSIGSGKPLAGVDMLGLIAANSSQLTTWGAFSGLMMGISLTAMTVFLYPIFRRDFSTVQNIRSMLRHSEKRRFLVPQDQSVPQNRLATNPTGRLLACPS